MSRLPATLARWEESLAGIDAAVAVALGPLLHVLDELVGRVEQVSGADGELDGYDGIDRRGDPGRLLTSEWLLADELPLEFLRRAAENELSYLRPAFRAPAPGGTVVVACDAGPEQWGAGRLVQLAALVVLDRRARAAGAELVVTILQDGACFDGQLAEILPPWLRARSSRAPTEAEVAQVLDGAGDGERVWLLTGPTTRGLVPRHRRALSSWPASWGVEGVERAGLRVGDGTTEVAVPSAPAAVAALRGEGISRTRRTAVATIGSIGQAAVFGSADNRVLWRGDSDRVVHACFVGGDRTPRIRRHELAGAVLAAASLGRRLVAVVTDGDRLRVQVVGKDLARTHRIELSLADVALTADDVTEIVQAPLRPLYLRRRTILVPFGDRWWYLGEDGAEDADVDAAAPGEALDNPRVALRRRSRVFVVGGASLPGVSTSAGLVLGPESSAGPWLATSADSRVWTVWQGEDQVAEIGVAEGEDVIGLCLLGAEPALVVTTASRRLLRAITARHTKTWTRWAGPAHFDLHPTRPWVVRTKEDGILVGDLESGLTLADLRVER